MTIVAEILDCMSGITKPQRKFILTLFATMMVTGRRLNFLNLSRHSSLHEKTYRRQFRKAFAVASFNQSSIARAIPEASTKLFAQDASFSAKSGQQTYGLDTFWNGTAAKAERGLEVSLISILDVEEHQCFALSAEQTPPHTTEKKLEKRETRIDFHLAHLRRTAAYFPATIKFWSVSLKRHVRGVVVVVNTKENKKPRYVVLFSTDAELCAADILRFYKARFAIEFIFRDAKGLAGFSDCQARDKEALHFHFNASVRLVNLARIRAQAEHQAEAKLVFSMASIKQRAFNEHWLNLIISKLALDQSAIINHPQFECLRNYAAIAA